MKGKFANLKSTINTMKFNPTFMIKFFPVVIMLILAVGFIIFHDYFNSYTEVLTLNNDGYLVSSYSSIDMLKNKDISELEENLDVVSVHSSDAIYLNSFNKYVDAKKENVVNIDYPLFISEGLSITNYNEKINLINSNLSRITGYPGVTISYGKLFDSYTFDQIDYESYILLGYSNGIYLTLYDLKVETFDNTYEIPTNSFIYFSDDYINYYIRTDEGFKKGSISNVHISDKVSFYYNASDENYSYIYQDLLVSLDIIRFKEDKPVLPEKPIIKDEDQIEVVLPDYEYPDIDFDFSDSIGNDEDVPFVWTKPTVSSGTLSANVYSITGSIEVNDPAGVILSAPTYTLYVNDKSFARRSFYGSGNFSINGLLPNTTYTILGQYVYLDEDLTTKKQVTFYYNELTTLDMGQLPAIDIKFENGEIYSKKIEVKNLKIVSDLNSESLKGVTNGAIVVDDVKYYLSAVTLNRLISGLEIDEASTSEGLKSNREYDYSIEFYDRSGGIIKTINNTGKTRTCYKVPSVILRLINNDVDSITFGVNVRNDDELDIQNFRYVITNESGRVIDNKNIDGNKIVIRNLDPDQLYTIKIYGNIDLNDGKGLSENVLMASSTFTSLPISSLGFLNIKLEAVSINSYDAKLRMSINQKKTDARLIKLLKKFEIALYEKVSVPIETPDDLENQEEISKLIVKKISLSSSDVNKLKNGEVIDIDIDNLESNKQYYIDLLSTVVQGETSYDLGCVNDFEQFKTTKVPAIVEMKNLYVTSNLIDFDVRTQDVDNTILTDYVRMELRNEKGVLITSKLLNVNEEEFQRVTIEKLTLKTNYTLTFYADEYNVTDSYSTYEYKYVLYESKIFTEEGISGSITLISANRENIGRNLIDLTSETKWIETVATYDIPKTIDEEGHMHLYAKTGGSLYHYDLSEYHNKTIFVSFEIREVKPVTTSGYAVYFGNYLIATTTSTLNKKLTGLSSEWKKFSYTLTLGHSYKNNTDYGSYENYPQPYYGKEKADFVGFYIQNPGGSTLYEYEVRNMYAYVLDEEDTEYDLSDNELRHGRNAQSGNTIKYDDSSKYIETRVGLEKPLYFKANTKYTFHFPNDIYTIDMAMYLFNSEHTFLVDTGWLKDGYSFIPKEDLIGYANFYKSATSLGDGNLNISPEEIDFSITVTELEDSVGMNYEPFEYEYMTKVKVNLKDTRKEIVSQSYFVNVYDDNNNLLLENEYKDLSDDKLEIIDEIKKFQTEENKNLRVALEVKIRERSYELDSFELTTDAEVVGINNLNDWFYIQPKGHYVVLADLDFREYTVQSLGWNYKYFYGVIDFQGHTMIADTSKYFMRIARVEKSAVLKNLVLEVHNTRTSSSTSGYKAWIQYMYGRFENIILHLIDERTDPRNQIEVIAAGLSYNLYNSATIENFIVYLDGDYHMYKQSGLLFKYVGGDMKNGYMYGSDIVVTGAGGSGIGASRDLGGIISNNSVRSQISNVYTLNNARFEENTKDDIIGLVVGELAGTINNVYSVGDTNIDYPGSGPIFRTNTASSTVNNAYYVSDYVYTRANLQKISPVALSDPEFQNSVLGDGFNSLENVRLGYYPHLNFTYNKMPAQEFIPLPDVSEEDLVDIISMEIKSQTDDEAIVEVVVHNPLGESIDRIPIVNLKTEIVSQVYNEGKSIVTLKVSEPSLYVSKYQVRSVSSVGYGNYVSTREYALGERYLYIDFYKHIYTVDDWKTIKSSYSENYRIMEDLDFMLETNYTFSTFSGKLAGDNHTFSNIIIDSGNASGLINTLNGSISDLYIENFQKTNNSQYYGLTGVSSSTASFNNVHMKDVYIRVDDARTGANYVGALTANTSAKIVNCSVTNVTIRSEATAVNALQTGGLVGYSNSASLSNVYAQNVDIDVTGSISAYTGGLVGNLNTKSDTISDAYTTGKISSNSTWTGGIVGHCSGYVERTYSTVDVQSDLEYISGIATTVTGINDYLLNNIFLGTLYTSYNTDVYGKITVTSIPNETNFSLDNIIINGWKSDKTNGETLLKLEDMYKEETYKSVIEFGDSYDYSQVEDKILPKLYYFGTEDLLPNQLDNRIFEDILEIQDVVVNKDVEQAIINLYIYNPDNYQIEDININGGNVKITNVGRQGDTTAVRLEFTPTKFYDNYMLSSISYKEHPGDEEVKYARKSVKIDMIFYKYLRTVDDWNHVDLSDPENYLILNDIDFTGREFNVNVPFNRLESPGDDVTYTISGMEHKYTGTVANYAVISKVMLSLKNVNFENIKLTSTSTSNLDGFGLINVCRGEVYNLSFKNIDIDTVKRNYAAIISKKYTFDVDKVYLEHVNVSGRASVAGFIGYLDNKDKTIGNITAKDIHVTGQLDNNGVIVGNVQATDTKNIVEWVDVRDSSVTVTGSGGYFGGICGSCNTLRDSTVDNVVISSETATHAGGAIGRIYSSIGRVTVSNSKISAKNYAGGVFGTNASDTATQLYSYKNKIQAETNAAGIGAYNGAIRYSGAEEVEVTATVKNAGGLMAYSSAAARTISYSFVHNSTISSPLYSGGIEGTFVRGNRINISISDTNIYADDYAGGIMGRYNQTGSNSDYIREIELLNVNVISQNNAGALYGQLDTFFKNADLFKRYYFEGSVTAKDGKAGLGSADQYNGMVTQLGYVGIYDGTLINNRRARDVVGENTFTNTQVVAEHDGYITTAGKIEKNNSYPRAIYSDMVQLKAGKTYKLSATPNDEYLYDFNAYFFVAFYTPSGGWLGESSTATNVANYVGYIHNNDQDVTDRVLTIFKDCAVRFRITDSNRVERGSLTISELHGDFDDVEKERLMNRDEIGNSLNWVTSLPSNSSTAYDRHARIGFTNGRWNMSGLDHSFSNMTINSEVAGGKSAVAKLSGFTSKGAVFNGLDDVVEIKNFVFPTTGFTYSFKINSFSTKTYQSLFSCRTATNNGIFIWKSYGSLYIRVANTSTTSKALRFYRDSVVTITYDGTKVLKVYMDGRLVTTNNGVKSYVLPPAGTPAYIGDDFNYHSDTYRLASYMEYAAFYDRTLSEEEIQANHATGLQTDLTGIQFYYDFTKYENTNRDYYPLVTNSNYYPVLEELQPITYLPDNDRNYVIPTSLYGDNILGNVKLSDNYKVYSSGINTLNIEFKELTPDLKLTYEVDGVEYSTKVREKTHTLYYDYKSPIKIKIKSSLDEVEQVFNPSDLAKSIVYTNNNYYVIKDNKLYENKELLLENVVHLFNNLAIDNEGNIYSLSEHKNISKFDKSGFLGNNVPLHSTQLVNTFIDTYYGYSLVTDISGNQNYRTNQIYYKDNNVFIYEYSDIINNQVLFGKYNGSLYQMALNNNGEIISYKSAINYSSKFRNSNIVEISTNPDNENSVLFVKYDNGTLVGLDFVSGDIVYQDGELPVISLFSYFANNFKSSNLIGTHDDSYLESAKLIKELNDITDKEVLDRLNSLSSIDIISGSLDGLDNVDIDIEEGDDIIGDTISGGNIANATIPEKYTIVYNEDTNSYEVYNVNDLLNPTKENVVNEYNKIKSDSFLYNYFNSNKINDSVRTNRTLIYLVIISSIIATLAFFILHYRKKEIVNE